MHTPYNFEGKTQLAVELNNRSGILDENYFMLYRNCPDRIKV